MQRRRAVGVEPPPRRAASRPAPVAVCANHLTAGRLGCPGLGSDAPPHELGHVLVARKHMVELQNTQVALTAVDARMTPQMVDHDPL